MRSKAYILQSFCIIDSMKLYNQGFPFLYNTFYQGWGQNFAEGGGKILPRAGPPAPATPLQLRWKGQLGTNPNPPYQHSKVLSMHKKEVLSTSKWYLLGLLPNVNVPHIVLYI